MLYIYYLTVECAPEVCSQSDSTSSFRAERHAHGGHGLIQCDDGLDEDDIDLDDVPMPVVSSASSDSMSAVNNVSYASILLCVVYLC